MYRTTRPTLGIIFSSILTFIIIVFIGSFSDVNEAIGLATLFVGLPWLIFYFLEWLGGSQVKAIQNELQKLDDGSQPQPPNFSPYDFR